MPAVRSSGPTVHCCAAGSVAQCASASARSSKPVHVWYSQGDRGGWDGGGDVGGGEAGGHGCDSSVTSARRVGVPVSHGSRMQST